MLRFKSKGWRSSWERTRQRSTKSINDAFDFIVAACVSTVILCGWLLTSEILLHWFVVPVFVCGVLIGADGVAWVRRRLDLFDPVGLVGAYGYYFFFVAPLLTVAWKYHSPWFPEPPDWRSWIGWMAVINCAGLIVYRIARAFLQERAPAKTWKLDRGRLVRAMVVALPISVAMQIYIFVRFGGIWGFMQSFSQGNHAFEGMGWQFVIADPLPYLLATLVLVRYRTALRRAPWVTIACFIVAFFVLKLVFGGLRGSRSSTVWGLFWLVGAIHFWIKPVPRKMVVVGVSFLLAFMFVYGFYKAQGIEAFNTLRSRETTQDAALKTGRTLDSTLLADMARTETQAYLLYRLQTVQLYDYVHGTTYASAFSIFVPKSLRPEWLISKVQAGTDALYGRNSYRPSTFAASQVYGLTGEAMLNFGPWFAPAAFVFLAYAVVKVRAIMNLHCDDVRLLMLPFLVNGSMLIVSSDLDNLVVFLVMTAFTTSTVLALSVAPARTFANSRRRRELQATVNLHPLSPDPRT